MAGYINGQPPVPIAPASQQGLVGTQGASLETRFYRGYAMNDEQPQPRIPGASVQTGQLERRVEALLAEPSEAIDVTEMTPTLEDASAKLDERFEDLIREDPGRHAMDEGVQAPKRDKYDERFEALMGDEGRSP